MTRLLALSAALSLALLSTGCPEDRAGEDAGIGLDASDLDAGAPDAGASDAGPDDASSDAGVDAGPPPARRFLTDDQGRALILHGFNDGTAKGHPDFSPSWSEEDLPRFVSSWGFNALRYLVFWEAAEPEMGRIDEAYLDRVEERLDWAAAHGMLVVLDMHQDVYARRFCCNGAPEWAIRDDGKPFVLQDIWALNYFQPAVQAAFDHFWSYEGDDQVLQDHYGDVLVRLAERFGDHPALVGYDLMNEPFGGTAVDVGEIGTGVATGPGSRTSRFDRDKLIPFYQRIVARIRAVDADSYIFFEPRYGAAGNGAVQYLPEVEDPRDGEPRIVYAPHLYSVRYETVNEYREDDRTVERWEAARVEESRATNYPIWLGEFGMDRTFPGAERYLDDVLDMADRMMISWAYWAYDPGTWSFWDPTTRTEESNIDQLVRAYPQRVAGTPIAWSWDRRERVFTLRFDHREGVTGPTEIFVPADRFFPGGFEVTSSDPEESWSQSFDADRNLLSLTTSASVASHEFTIRAR